MAGWAKNEFQKSSWKMAESKGGEVNCEPNAKILKEWGNLPAKLGMIVIRKQYMHFTAHGSRAWTQEGSEQCLPSKI